MALVAWGALDGRSLVVPQHLLTYRRLPLAGR